VAIALRRGSLGGTAVAAPATRRGLVAPRRLALPSVRAVRPLLVPAAVAARWALGPARAVCAVPAMVWAEWVCALALAAAVCAAGFATWRFALDAIEPARPATPVPAQRPRSVPLSDPQAVEDFQRAMELAGEADTYLLAGKLEWARATAERALALDPANATAQSVRARLDRAAPEPMAPDAAPA
jgi:hypothetical protein